MTIVHLLLHDLDADPTPDDELDAVLNAEERTRAARYFNAVHQRRYRVGRALLRRTIASWTGTPPERLGIEYGPQGKPQLPAGPAFNLSHSDGALLLGLTEAGRLGVDIELLRPIDERAELAARNFAADEVRALRELPSAEQDEGFLRIWTRKEAFIKALGGGLSVPLQSFCVSAATTTGNALRSIDRAEHAVEEANDWSILSVPIAGRHPPAVAALAIDSPACNLTWLR